MLGVRLGGRDLQALLQPGCQDVEDVLPGGSAHAWEHQLQKGDRALVVHRVVGPLEASGMGTGQDSLALAGELRCRPRRARGPCRGARPARRGRRGRRSPRTEIRASPPRASGPRAGRGPLPGSRPRTNAPSPHPCGSPPGHRSAARAARRRGRSRCGAGPPRRTLPGPIGWPPPEPERDVQRVGRGASSTDASRAVAYALSNPMRIPSSLRTTGSVTMAWPRSIAWRRSSGSPPVLQARMRSTNASHRGRTSSVGRTWKRYRSATARDVPTWATRRTSARAACTCSAVA